MSEAGQQLERLARIIAEMDGKLTAANERAEKLQAENTALLAANRDLQSWFDDCNAERKKLQARIDESQKQEPCAWIVMVGGEYSHIRDTNPKLYDDENIDSESEVIYHPLFQQPIIPPDVEPALKRYVEFCEGDEIDDPIEALRFFCSLCMKTPQDWLDIEQFFDAVTAERTELRKRLEESKVPECDKCLNRGKAMHYAQESYCEHCKHHEKWRKDYYAPSLP